MKKKILLMLSIGVSFAPAVFADVVYLNLNESKSALGQDAKIGQADEAKVGCPIYRLAQKVYAEDAAASAASAGAKKIR